MKQVLRSLLTGTASAIPLRAYCWLDVLAKVHYMPNISNPSTYNELLVHKKIYDRDPLIPRTADKYLLRAYVTERLGPGYLASLLHVARHVSEINVAQLPPAYAMKAAHGSGWNRIVHAGELTQQEAESIVAGWLGQSYYWKRREWAYKPLTPSVVFEENLSVDGKPPSDFKFFVFGGVPRMIQVDADRFSGHQRVYYSPEWEMLNVTVDYPRPPNPVSRPEQLSEMLKIAATLAEPFTFARVDLYSLPDRVVVGEITHYPDSGVVRFKPAEFDRELGEVWRNHRPIGRKYVVS